MTQIYLSLAQIFVPINLQFALNRTFMDVACQLNVSNIVLCNRFSNILCVHSIDETLTQNKANDMDSRCSCIFYTVHYTEWHTAIICHMLRHTQKMVYYNCKTKSKQFDVKIDGKKGFVDCTHFLQIRLNCN